MATLRACEPVLEIPGVLVAGSEVPNLLQPGSESTLVVSQDLDLVIPVSRHSEVKRRLNRLEGLSASTEEPSVFLPDDPRLLEVNFIGLDPDADHSYVLEDPTLPLLVFRLLRHLRPGAPVAVGGLQVPVPRAAGLVLEKLLTERSGLKGERDLLVALALILVADEDDLGELEHAFSRLVREEQRSVLANLSLLSVLQPVDGMPHPDRGRDRVARVQAALEGIS